MKISLSYVVCVCSAAMFQLPVVQTGAKRYRCANVFLPAPCACDIVWLCTVRTYVYYTVIRNGLMTMWTQSVRRSRSLLAVGGHQRPMGTQLEETPPFRSHRACLVSRKPVYVVMVVDDVCPRLRIVMRDKTSRLRACRL
jgi:hypothetical protein